MLTLLQEAASQPQPKHEKQGSGLKKGLKKLNNGVRNVADSVKDWTSSKLNKTPGPVTPVPTPVAPPAQGSTSASSELQRGGSLKNKLKTKSNISRRGEIFVHIDVASSLLHRSRHMTRIHCGVWCDSKM